MRLRYAVLGLSMSMAATSAFAANDAARKLAQDAIVVDTHIDAPSELLSH